MGRRKAVPGEEEVRRRRRGGGKSRRTTLKAPDGPPTRIAERGDNGHDGLEFVDLGPDRESEVADALVFAEGLARLEQIAPGVLQ